MNFNNFFYSFILGVFSILVFSLMIFFLMIILFLLQLIIIAYSGLLFFKVINKKIIEYNYNDKDSIFLLFIKYGLLIFYVLFIYALCNNKILGFPFIILLLFFNKALKKELHKNKDKKE